MPEPLPQDMRVFMDWSWEQIGAHYAALDARPLMEASLPGWLDEWSALTRRVVEMRERLYVATTRNTADAEAEQRYNRYLNEIFPASEAAEQALKEKLLASGLEPAGFEVTLRGMRAEAALFHPDNLALLSEEKRLVNEHEKIIGAQSVMWQGQERTLPQLVPLLQDPDRSVREAIWRLARERQLADREALNDLWQRFLHLRLTIARNAAKPTYRDYIWQSKLRFDYTPDDCLRFHQAIEEAVVPAAQRVYERRRQQLGVATLRPWDLSDGWYGRPLDPPGLPPLQPFANVAELEATTARIFHQVDPQLGAYFEIMRKGQLLDLENRKHKAPGGYCTSFPYENLPFIFMNAVGLHDDVQTLLHEGGHAFHNFERRGLRYYHQVKVGHEMAEVASMSMELLAAPYLSEQHGGFYSEDEAARARLEHLEGMLLFWPFMAVVDAFQHWVYLHPEDALVPTACEAQWTRLWQRFLPGVDWTGLEQECATGWQRKLHIFQLPFYYVEYGLAQLGAAQVWRNALDDQAGAVAAYRRALALGGTAPLPQLYAAAGARFTVEVATLREAVTLIEAMIEKLMITD